MSGPARQIHTKAMIVYSGGTRAEVIDIRLIFVPGETPDKDRFVAHVVAPRGSADGMQITFWRANLDAAVTSGVPVP